MANFGSLGIGNALNLSLNTGLDTGNKFAEYQQNRYLEPSAQLSKLSDNQADMWENHNRELRQAALSPELANKMQQAPLSEVQSAQLGQNANFLANQQLLATNQGTLAAALNASPYQDVGTYGEVAQLTPEQAGQRLLELMRMNGGNPQQSLQGVISGGN